MRRDKPGNENNRKHKRNAENEEPETERSENYATEGENSTSRGYTIDAEVVGMPIKYGNKVMIQNTQNTLMKYRCSRSETEKRRKPAHALRYSRRKESKSENGSINLSMDLRWVSIPNGYHKGTQGLCLLDGSLSRLLIS